MEAGSSCAACAATVTAEEVAQGFAVRVGGQLLCPLCIDRLPGDAQVKVNQMRALRGMATKTYRVPSPRHPGLVMYSFTTAALVLAHRRHLVRGGVFETPLLPPPGSRPRLPSAAEAGRGQRHGWLIAGALAVIVLAALAWLIASTTGGRSRPAPTPAPDPAPVPVAPVQPTPTADPGPVRLAALRLTELENRLRAHPEAAVEIQRDAERLRDDLPPGELALRNRADALAHEAAARIPPPEPPKPVEVTAPRPPEPAPPEQPQAVKPQPAEQPQAVKPQPAEQPQAAKPQPAEQPQAVKPQPPAPVPDAGKPRPPAKPETRPWMPTSWPSAQRDACRIDPAREADVPWPWPVGGPDDGLLRAQPTKANRKRMQLDLAVTGLGGDGGIVLSLHPGRRDRTTLSAAWSDGATVVPLPPIRFAGMAWQAVAVPAPGPEVARENLRLQLADGDDLDRDQPFLVGPGRIVTGAAPAAADWPPPLPLLAPDPATADGNAFRRAFVDRIERARAAHRNRLDVNALGILIAGISPYAEHEVRLALKERLGITPANGNPTELPPPGADLNDPAKPWPGRIDDLIALDRWQAVAFGAGGKPWGRDADLLANVGATLSKLQLTAARTKLKAVLPVLIVGSPDPLAADEQRALDARWAPVLAQCAVSGLAVIDLRSAQREELATAKRERAAALLAEGWRQVGVLVARLKP